MTVRRIEVVPHNPRWSSDFASEASAINRILKDVNHTVHHIGSTSVKGLSAKPIIDILLEVDSLDALEAHYPAFEKLGYTPKGEFGIERRRYFKKGGIQHSHHLHAYAFADEHVLRHLAFRDYLITNSAAREEYQAIKEEGARIAPTDPDAYMAHKNAFIQKHEKIALEHFAY